MDCQTEIEDLKRRNEDLIQALEDTQTALWALASELPQRQVMGLRDYQVWLAHNMPPEAADSWQPDEWREGCLGRATALEIALVVNLPMGGAA